MLIRLVDTCSRSLVGALYPIRCYQTKHNSEVTKSSLDELNIYDTEQTYKSKSTFELCRSLMVLKLCTYNMFVKNSEWLMRASRRMLGQALFDMVMKKTIYGQFAGGVDIEEMTPVIHHLGKHKVDSMLNYSVETDLGHEKTEEDTKSENSLDVLCSVLEASTKVCTGRPLSSFKITGLTTISVLYQFTEVLDAIRGVFVDNSSVFVNTNQFMLQLPDLIRNDKNLLVNRRMSREDFIKLIIKYNENVTNQVNNEMFINEIFNDFDSDGTGYLEYYQFQDLILQTVDVISLYNIPTISTELQKDIDKLNEKLDRLARKTKELDTRFMIDAEQTYFQPAIDYIARKCIRKHNRDKAYIFNTYQCYLKRTPNNVLLDSVDALTSGYHLGVKLVRGAYMEQERARAQEVGYASPINETKALTDKTYHNMLDVLFQLVNKGRCTTLAASHNEITVQYVRQKIADYGFDPQDDKVYFGQLFGLCDPITFSLSNNGYVAVKAIAYGPVEAVLPFLARRAQENNGVLAGTAREMNLLKLELRRRAKPAIFV